MIILATVGAMVGLPDTAVRRPGHIDLLGSVVLGAALVGILLAVTEGRSWGWGSIRTIGLLLFGVIAMIAFVVIELRSRDPLIDVRAIQQRGAWTAHIGALIVGFGMFALFVLVPTLLQIPIASRFGFGATPTESGFTLVPAVVMMILFSAVAGAVLRHTGARALMVIGAVVLTGAFTIAALNHQALWLVITCVALAGAGIGIALSSIANTVVHAVPADRTAEALSTNTIARTISGSIGTAVVAAFLAAHTSTQGSPADAGFTLGLWVSAIVSVVGVVVALLVPRPRVRR